MMRRKTIRRDIVIDQYGYLSFFDILVSKKTNKLNRIRVDEDRGGMNERGESRSQIICSSAIRNDRGRKRENERGKRTVKTCVDRQAVLVHHHERLDTLSSKNSSGLLLSALNCSIMTSCSRRDCFSFTEIRSNILIHHDMFATLLHILSLMSSEIT